KNTMVGAGTYLPQDTPPYIVAAGKPAQFRGLNLVGLRRKGFTNDQVNALKKAYKLLYASALNRTQAIEQIRNDEIYSDQHVQNIVTFVEESKRGLLK
ncbi:MAG: acyl-[acyl-carrier-protein]--UDP-N-acetylglucosamine O-acyltransferase, partial [Melioribacteraceae bacterium]|nr:acyl-[acyl-carrier-protein]--UDP-N-acetylglucosamine O-acyltransferase [Melioribacteraceae bacterium]